MVCGLVVYLIFESLKTLKIIAWLEIQSIVVLAQCSYICMKSYIFYLYMYVLFQRIYLKWKSYLIIRILPSSLSKLTSPPPFRSLKAQTLYSIGSIFEDLLISFLQWRYGPTIFDTNVNNASNIQITQAKTMKALIVSFVYFVFCTWIIKKFEVVQLLFNSKFYI